MSKAPPVDIKKILAAVGRGAVRVLRETIPRTYAFVILCVVSWLTYRAVRYLIVSLALASAPPPQIIGLPTRLDGAVLAEPRSAFAALDAAENPRMPLAHYHQIDTWVEPDVFNNCTQSGCHGPLPHTKRKEVRAFLNMHATSVQCGVCHMTGDEKPRAMVWYDLGTGTTTSTPPIMKAYALLTDEARWSKPTEEDRKTLVELLRAAAVKSQSLAALNRLAGHFESLRTTSGTYPRLVEEAREAVARHFRGEYGAKLALRDPASGGPILGHPGTEAKMRHYLDNKDKMSKKEKEELIQGLHPRKREKPLDCTDCHARQDSLVDFSALGYPPARLSRLTQPAVFQMIENINHGRPFNLPLATGDLPDAAAPTTQPATQP